MIIQISYYWLLILVWFLLLISIVIMLQKLKANNFHIILAFGFFFLILTIHLLIEYWLVYFLSVCATNQEYVNSAKFLTNWINSFEIRVVP